MGNSNISLHIYRSIVTALLIVIIVIIGGGVIADWYNHSVKGNRLTLDHYQTFNVAYIRGDGGCWDKIEISSWTVDTAERACQVVTKDGTPIYTSFSNVILTKE